MQIEKLKLLLIKFSKLWLLDEVVLSAENFNWSVQSGDTAFQDIARVTASFDFHLIGNVQIEFILRFKNFLQWNWKQKIIFSLNLKFFNNHLRFPIISSSEACPPHST